MQVKPQTQTIKIYLKSFSKVDQNLIRRYLEKKLNIFLKVFKQINFCDAYFYFTVLNLPTNIRKLTLLKSPHVHKKAKQHFIQTEYVTLITIQVSSQLLLLDFALFKLRLNNFFNYFIMNCPNSVNMTIAWEKTDTTK